MIKAQSFFDWHRYNMDFYTILLIAPPIILSLTVHEYAHALSAWYFGDDTAKKLGRLTLNPLAHLDFLGTIMLFIVHLGWAKPVPVNPANFANPRKAMLYVSLAGPASNIVLAFFCGLCLRFLDVFLLESGPAVQMVIIILNYGLYINLVLAFFNMIPIPPLDGSKVLFSFIPSEYDSYIEKYSAVGPWALLLLILLGNRMEFSVIWLFVEPPVSFFTKIFGGTPFF